MVKNLSMGVDDPVLEEDLKAVKIRRVPADQHLDVHNHGEMLKLGRAFPKVKNEKLDMNPEWGSHDADAIETLVMPNELVEVLTKYNPQYRAHLAAKNFHIQMSGGMICISILHFCMPLLLSVTLSSD